MRPKKRGRPKGKKVLDNLFFIEPMASILETRRAELRGRHRIIYDCRSAIAYGTRVKCRRGHSMSTQANGSLALLSVLRGRSCRFCQTCAYYEDDEVC